MQQTFETFGKYILLEKIQTGGMAEIYLALRPGTGGVSKFLAIKRILPQYSEQQEFIEMFKDEAKIAVNLSHANIVGIHEFGMERNQLFLAMDYVEGRNLRQILNKMKKSNVGFSLEQILYIIKEVAGGLDHAHRCIDSNTGKPLNIIHRDMSPQNIMVSFEGEVKVVDFGIAKAATQVDTTRAGTLKGKFGYMSPEQAEGQSVDLRTDVFALGIVLWELLANDRLFVANNEINTLRKVRECQIPSLRKINPNIPVELERIVSKALAKDRNLRYQTEAAFHRELSRFLNRQFPDFSPHDFSVFVKTLYSAEIHESRRKMIGYAKAEIDAEKLDVKSEISEVSNFTSSATKTEATITQEESKPPRQVVMTMNPPLSKAPQQKPTTEIEAPTQQASQPVIIEKKRPPVAPPAPPTPSAAKGINTMSLTVDRSSYAERESRSGPHKNLNNSGIHTNTRSYSQLNIKSTGLSFPRSLSLMVIMFVVAFGSWPFLPDEIKRPINAAKVDLIRSYPGIAEFLGEKTVQTSQGDTQTPTPIKTAPVFSVNIKSDPPNGEIEIDGQPVGTTPLLMDFRALSTKKVVVKLKGYSAQEKIVFVDKNMELDFKLLGTRVGIIDINIVGSGQIFIDGVKVANSGPYSATLNANKDYSIRAHDPATGAGDEWRGRVGENERKQISLLPGKTIKRQGASQKK